MVRRGLVWYANRSRKSLSGLRSERLITGITLLKLRTVNAGYLTYLPRKTLGCFSKDCFQVPLSSPLTRRIPMEEKRLTVDIPEERTEGSR